MILMTYVPETYEERADFAEYQVERLEEMMYRFIRESSASEASGLEELREAWKEYREEYGYYK